MNFREALAEAVRDGVVELPTEEALLQRPQQRSQLGLHYYTVTRHHMLERWCWCWLKLPFR